MITVDLPDGRTVDVQTDDPEVAARAAHKFRMANPHPEAAARNGTLEGPGNSRMRNFRITSPDGRTFEVSAPEGATREEVMARVQAHAASTPSTKNTVAGLAGNFLDAMIPGAAGAVRGAREVALNAIRAPFSAKEDFHPLQSYREGQAFQEARQKAASEAYPGTASAIAAAGLAGGMALPVAKVARGVGLAGKVAAGAKTAGAYGALSGALSSKASDYAGVLSDGIKGALSSAVVGTALPVAAKVAHVAAAPIAAPLARMAAPTAAKVLQSVGSHIPGNVGRAITNEARYLAQDPALSQARQIVGQDLRNAVNPATGRNWTPMSVAKEVSDRHAAGVPAAPADVHESARRSFGAAARAPGPGLTSVRRMIDQRQERSGIRLADQVREHLGPTANIDRQAEVIRDTAQAAARPHYDAAYAAAGASDSGIAEIVGNQSGAMKSALAHARELALREGRDPTALGFDLTDHGEVTLNRVPSFETLDLVKRGLDGVADGTRDAFGNLTNDGRTIKAMSRPLVARMREVNPEYGKALDAFGGEIAGRDALLAGRDSLKSGADDIANVIDGMSPYEAQNFAVGNRSAMANDLSDFARKTPYGNAAARLRQNYGLPGTDTFQAMQRVHGAEGIDNLARVGEMEHQANQTYQAIRGNSATADRLAEMAAQDAKIAGAAKGALQMFAGRPVAGALSTLGALASGDIWNAGATKGHVAEILGETDAAKAFQALREVGRENARRAVMKQRIGVLQTKASRPIGALAAEGMVQPYDDGSEY